MKCAPILITTLNRHVHFIRLIESLKRNTWAKYTPVYVALDYPPSQKYMEGYSKICKYLEGEFDEFCEFNIIKRERNYGSAKNMLELREFILGRYDRFIRTDDDAEFSPNFLEYMNKCFDEYEDDPNVIAVTGYSYPLKWKTADKASVFKENFICPMWGTGFWTKKYKELEDRIVNGKILQRDVKAIILNGGLKNMTDVCRQEYLDLCLSPDFDVSLAAKVTDVSVRMYMAIYDKYIVVPTISKVRNWGFDGTGEFCPNHKVKQSGFHSFDYPYHKQSIDDGECFVILKDTLLSDNENRQLFNEFDCLSLRNKLKSMFKLSLFIIVGSTLFFRLIYLVRKVKEIII